MDRGDRAILAGAAWLLAGLASGVLAGALAVRGDARPELLLWSSLATQGLWVGLAVGVAALLQPGRSRREALDLGPLRIGTGALLLLGAGLIALSQGASLWLQALELRSTGSLGRIDELAGSAQGPSLLLALVALGIGPGLAEELLFRGLLQTWLARRLGALAGILLAAAAFALPHLDPVHAPAAFLLGAYLGAIAHLAGSVRASMLWHAVNNSLALLGSRAVWGPVPGGPWLAGGVLIAVAAAILLLAARRLRHSPLGDERGERQG